MTTTTAAMYAIWCNNKYIDCWTKLCSTRRRFVCFYIFDSRMVIARRRIYLYCHCHRFCYQDLEYVLCRFFCTTWYPDNRLYRLGDLVKP